jgi:hypothetical protein
MCCRDTSIHIYIFYFLSPSSYALLSGLISRLEISATDECEFIPLVSHEEDRRGILNANVSLFIYLFTKEFRFTPGEQEESWLRGLEHMS